MTEEGLKVKLQYLYSAHQAQFRKPIDKEYLNKWLKDRVEQERERLMSDCFYGLSAAELLFLYETLNAKKSSPQGRSAEKTKESKEPVPKRLASISSGKRSGARGKKSQISRNGKEELLAQTQEVPH